MAKFVVFGTPGGMDVMVNTDHIVAVDPSGDGTQEGESDTCRLWLTADLWTDDDGENGQNYVEVVGSLLDVHRVLNHKAQPS